MRVAMMTKEYPPEIYGGAGVHVTELTAQLKSLCDVDIHCMGAPRDTAQVHDPDPALAGANAALTTLSAELRMANAAADADVVHSHTWYTGLAGHLAAELYDVPHILTAHSLEPRRPWKAEQLGGGYRISSWSERNAVEYADAVIAVSEGMAKDVLDAYPRLDPSRVHVVRNGIDTQRWFADQGTATLDEIGVDRSKPIVAFVGRITRQKGVGHLIAAAHHFDPSIQLVLCAGAPDTPEIAAETERAVALLAEQRGGVFWVKDMLPTDKIREILTAAAVFVCPSVYEPLGIVNLEAMACETAVVASDVGGIPEVVDEGRTGRLVHYNSYEPDAFERNLAETVNEVALDPALAAAMGKAGRERAVAEFSWASIAKQTLAVYNDALARRR
ncbi:glycogen synthase [Rhodococcus sp. 06-418-5]|uniref:glycogen synthase n=1 Tax=Nocardiaceae TaxID=85025 RepID=UPI00050C48EF|nr:MULTISPECIES: glycogen synthase [Rhodococcus]OZC72967.1 glycogen synthase [Rhodococcus sp. 06-418-5]OZD84114.1 glycogen synthase [Rhodococcus sp. 05-339-2]OZE15455.1 glycogen synthase [Rhodococcus sp. 05-2255-3B1]OZE16322.1 glycogen synthase [Rhodococcus sp. 05-2255-3C]OZE21177.1 glycogen synthase [Rhodococcus sp. 05-2255-2A2]